MGIERELKISMDTPDASATFSITSLLIFVSFFINYNDKSDQGTYLGLKYPDLKPESIP